MLSEKTWPQIASNTLITLDHDRTTLVLRPKMLNFHDRTTIALRSTRSNHAFNHDCITIIPRLHYDHTTTILRSTRPYYALTTTLSRSNYDRTTTMSKSINTLFLIIYFIKISYFLFCFLFLFLFFFQNS